MRRVRRALRAIAALLSILAAALFWSCSDRDASIARAPARLARRPEFYSSDPIRARIVDADTGRPVAGAVVVALWRKIDIYRERWDGIFYYVETVTADDGSFDVPRWGPRTLSYEHYLDRRDPELWILQRDYLLGYADNSGALDPRVFLASGTPLGTRFSKRAPSEMLLRPESGEYARPADARSVWDGKTLTLQRWSSPEAAARSFASAAPFEIHEPIPIRLPLFWAEWTAGKQLLPIEWQNRIEQPLPLMQRRGAGTPD